LSVSLNAAPETGALLGPTETQSQEHILCFVTTELPTEAPLRHRLDLVNREGSRRCAKLNLKAAVRLCLLLPTFASL